MYRFWVHELLKPELTNANCKIIYSDTDSNVFSNNDSASVYDLIRRRNNYFDTSEFTKDNILKIIPEKGLLKIENANEICNSVCCLRPKKSLS